MARFEKGHAKIAGSGIKRGQKHKKTIMRERLRDLIEKNGKHPVEEIVALIPRLSHKDQAQTWLRLLEFCEAKLSAQRLVVEDQTNAEDETVDVSPLTDEELLEAVSD